MAMATIPFEPISPAAAAAAMPTLLPERPSLATVAVTEVRDHASPDAAAARAKAIVERSFGVANAKILEPVVTKRIGDGGSAKRPRYQTVIVVEIPRGFGPAMQCQYFLTLQYVGSGEWQVEGMTFATRY
jgi:hypothetical protein